MTGVPRALTDCVQRDSASVQFPFTSMLMDARRSRGLATTGVRVLVDAVPNAL
jgi:hypothetical protein